MGASEVKRWLYRCISRDASSEELFGSDQKPHFEALDRLADYVQRLPDDDERFIRLAGAGLETDQDLATACLASRCASFGPGNDPDAWLTEYIGVEVSTLTGRYRINLGS